MHFRINSEWMPLVFSVLLDVCVFLLPLCWLVFSYGSILRKLHMDISAFGVRNLSDRHSVHTFAFSRHSQRHSMPTSKYATHSKEEAVTRKVSTNSLSNPKTEEEEHRKSLSIFENAAKNGDRCAGVESIVGNDGAKASAFELHTLIADHQHIHHHQQGSSPKDSGCQHKVSSTRIVFI